MISTRGRYALRVMIDIAENGGDGYITLDGIAERQGISEKYLEGILALLTRSGLLHGARGKNGGYKLTRPIREYTALSIIEVAEGSLSPVACLKEDAAPCEKSIACPTLPIWRGLYEVISGYLGGITLADLLGDRSEPAELSRGAADSGEGATR